MSCLLELCGGVTVILLMARASGKCSVAFCGFLIDYGDVKYFVRYSIDDME